jgi:hypothetical protein
VPRKVLVSFQHLIQLIDVNRGVKAHPSSCSLGADPVNKVSRFFKEKPETPLLIVLDLL